MRWDRGTDRGARFTELAVILGEVNRFSSVRGKLPPFAADKEHAKNEDGDNNDRRRDSDGNYCRPVNGSASKEESQMIAQT